MILAEGAPVAYLERGARSLITFGAPVEAWVEPLASLVKDGRLRTIELRRIDGEAPSEPALLEGLRHAGFADGYRGPTLRG